MSRFKIALSFDDVQLLDGLNRLESRSQVKLATGKGSVVPIMVAPMMAVNSLEMAKACEEMNIIHFLHRYNSIDHRVEFARNLNLEQTSYNQGVTIGFNENIKDVESLIEAGYGWINLDVAACFHVKTFSVLEDIATLCRESDVQLIVGNFSSQDFIRELYESLSDEALAGITHLKVSQGGGSACSTRLATGVGKPTFQAILDSVGALRMLTGDASSATCPQIIADGGIKRTGDMMKAFGAGAGAVMAGGLFAAHEECSEEYRHEKADGGVYYEYFGMASERAKRRHFGEVKNVEGVEMLKPLKGSVRDTIKTMKQNLQSGVSMCGYDNLEEFIGNGEFIRVTSSGVYEASTHGKK